MTEQGRAQPLSEWLKLLLDEVDRKKQEAERAEEERRRREPARDGPQEK